MALAQLRQLEGSLSDALGGCSFAAVLLPPAATASSGAPGAACWRLAIAQTPSPDATCAARAALWASWWAGASPQPASAQRPLHEPALVGEQVLDWCANLTASELCVQLLVAALSDTGRQLQQLHAHAGSSPLGAAAASVWRQQLATPLAAGLCAHALSSSSHPPAATVTAAAAQLATSAGDGSSASGDGGRGARRRRASQASQAAAETQQSRRHQRVLTSLLAAVTTGAAASAHDLCTHALRVRSLAALLAAASQGHDSDALAALAEGLARPVHTMACHTPPHDSQEDGATGVVAAGVGGGLEQRPATEAEAASLSLYLDAPPALSTSGGHAAGVPPGPHEATRLLCVGGCNAASPVAGALVAAAAGCGPGDSDSGWGVARAQQLASRRVLCELLHHFLHGPDSATATAAAAAAATAAGGEHALGRAGLWASLATALGMPPAAQAGGAAAYSDRSAAPPPHQRGVLLHSRAPAYAAGQLPPVAGAGGPPLPLPPLQAGWPGHRLVSRLDCSSLWMLQGVSELY